MLSRTSHAEFRRFLHELSGRLGAFPVASLWVGEYEDAEIGSVPEFAVADAILDLTTARSGQRDLRFLEVRKLRGKRLPVRTARIPAHCRRDAPVPPARRRADR